MAIEDLDLEFIDEEEEKKGDALDVDVDLSFSIGDAGDVTSTGIPAPASLSSNDVTNPGMKIPKELNNKASKKTPNNVKSIAQKRQENLKAKNQLAQKKILAQKQALAKKKTSTNQTVSRVATPRPNQPTQPVKAQKPQVQTTPVVNVDLSQIESEVYELREELAQIKQEMAQIKYHADLKVAVADAKVEFITDYLSDAKLLDHQVSEVLSRILKKSPVVKNEAIILKRYMAEFLAKSKKKKE